MKNKEEKVEKIVKLLSETDFNLVDQIEVLGNVFIRKGIEYSNISNNANLTKLNLANEIVKDIEKNGETLPNSIIRQGLLILSWLEK